MAFRFFVFLSLTIVFIVCFFLFLISLGFWGKESKLFNLNCSFKSNFLLCSSSASSSSNYIHKCILHSLSLMTRA